MKTAEAFAESNQYDLESHDEGGYLGIDTKVFAEKLREFAKLHVTEALKKAYQNGTVTNKPKFAGDINYQVDEDSILNAYSLNLIK
jgi:hypothetical protein